MTRMKPSSFISKSPQRLKAGTNVLAVEIHQADRYSTDLHFDLELIPVPPPLSYFSEFSPKDLETEVEKCLTQLPAHLQGAWAERFAFAFAGNPALARKSVRSSWHNWELRAELQADLNRPANAREAYQTSLELLRAEPDSVAVEARIENVMEAMRRLAL
jgi:hypothetical protein